MNVDQILADAKAILICNSSRHTSMEQGDLSPVIEANDWWLYWGDKSYHLGNMTEQEARNSAALKIST